MICLITMSGLWLVDPFLKPEQIIAAASIECVVCNPASPTHLKITMPLSGISPNWSERQLVL
jgi:predicted aldo/keto reductase-like oxidoreductase